MPLDYDGPIVTMEMVRDPAWYERHKIALAADGTMPYARYVVRPPGKVEIGLHQASLAVPPGVIVRQGTSFLYPPAVPDLIGLRDRKYFDKSGLGRHRGIADVMRYAAMKQTMDILASYDGFIPAAMDGKTMMITYRPDSSGPV